MKNLRRNSTEYKELKKAKLAHKKALQDPAKYKAERTKILEVIADLKFIPKWGALNISINKIG